VHKLGRITAVEIAIGGPYNSELGLLVSMGADQHNGQVNSAWSVESFTGVPHHYQEGSVNASAFLISYLAYILNQAHVTNISELLNKPVLCEFEEGELISWNLWTRTV
jgi:hypothetical protein